MGNKMGKQTEQAINSLVSGFGKKETLCAKCGNSGWQFYSFPTNRNDAYLSSMPPKWLGKSCEERGEDIADAISCWCAATKKYITVSVSECEMFEQLDKQSGN